MRTTICETLRTRAEEKVESMMDSPETEERIFWANVIQDSASCMEAIVEKVANSIGRRRTAGLMWRGARPSAKNTRADQ